MKAFIDTKGNVWREDLYIGYVLRDKPDEWTFFVYGDHQSYESVEIAHKEYTASEIFKYAGGLDDCC